MTPSLEQLMYQLSQFFLLPTLALIALMFAYAFYALGAFALQAWQRRGGTRENSAGNPGYRLLAWVARQPARPSADVLDVQAHRQLELLRVVTRVTPMLGLVATMIPMGPALKGLSDSNLAAVSENLTVAFSAVILALIASSITYWVVSVQRRWLAEELAWLGQAAPPAAPTPEQPA